MLLIGIPGAAFFARCSPASHPHDASSLAENVDYKSAIMGVIMNNGAPKRAIILTEVDPFLQPESACESCESGTDPMITGHAWGHLVYIREASGKVTAVKKEL